MNFDNVLLLHCFIKLVKTEIKTFILREYRALLNLVLVYDQTLLEIYSLSFGSFQPVVQILLSLFKLSSKLHFCMLRIVICKIGQTKTFHTFKQLAVSPQVFIIIEQGFSVLMAIELYLAFIELLEFFSLIVEISFKGNLIVFVLLFHLNEIFNIVEKAKRLLQKFLGPSGLATFVFLVMSVVDYFGSRFGFGPLIEYPLS